MNQRLKDMIVKSHIYRFRMIDDIIHARLDTYDIHCKNLKLIHQPDNDLNIVNRIRGDSIRSYKNHLLSINSILCLAAEYGGMDAIMSHYQAEKYAILIEHANCAQDLSAICDEFLYQYLHPKNRSQAYSHFTVSEAVNYYIARNFMHTIDIQQIADELHFSREHLSRVYKSETGRTISEKVIQIRLEEAKQFLIHTQMTITEIAMAVGFNSSQYFSKVFKRYIEMTPSQYRKAQKLNKNRENSTY